MSRKPLEKSELAVQMADLPSWELRNSKLYRSYTFKDFTSAFAFMTACAFEAEKQNHHPEWSNVYNRVSVELVTHETDQGIEAVTQKDIDLAMTMDSWAKKLA